MAKNDIAKTDPPTETAALDAAEPGRGEAAENVHRLARPEPLPSRLTEADLVAHRSFIEKMGAKAIWNSFWGAVTS